MKRLTILLLISVLVLSSAFAADSTYKGSGTSPTAASASMDLKLTSSILTNPVVLYGFYSNTGDTSKTSGRVIDGTLVLEEKLKSTSRNSSTRYGTGVFSVYFYCFSEDKLTGTLSWSSLTSSSSSSSYSYSYSYSYPPLPSTLSVKIEGTRSDNNKSVTSTSNSTDSKTSLVIFSFDPSSDYVYKHYTFTGTVTTEEYSYYSYYSYYSSSTSYTGAIYFTVTVAS